MSEKRKIVVLIDKNALNVEKEIADEAYTWEDYPDAKLRAADALCEAANPIVGEISNFADNDLTEYQVIRFKDLVRLRKAIAEYEGKQ